MLPKDVPAVPVTQTLMLSPEEEAQISRIHEQVAGEHAKAARSVLKAWHVTGTVLINELEPDMDGDRARFGDYGHQVVKELAERMGYDRSSVYTAVKLAARYPKLPAARVLSLPDGETTATPWTYADMRKLLSLPKAQAEEVLEWFGRPWQHGDYVLPPSKHYHGELCPRALYGQNKTSADLDQYLRFLKAPPALSTNLEPNRELVKAARKAGADVARYVAKVPAIVLPKLAGAIEKAEPDRVPIELRPAVLSALEQMDANIATLRAALTPPEEEGGSHA